MKRFLIYVLSLMAFLVFSAKSCETPGDDQAAEKEAILDATLDSINSALTADQPSIKTLRLLEMKAKQKLADLADYIRICNNRSLDENFRIHARNMIRDLFISDSIMISLDINGKMNDKSMLLVDFRRSTPGSTGEFLNFTIDSVFVSEPLHMVIAGRYEGNLTFIQNVRFPGSDTGALPVSGKKEVDIIAVRVTKSFGSDTLQIWGVFLGNIR